MTDNTQELREHLNLLADAVENNALKYGDGLGEAPSRVSHKRQIVDRATDRIIDWHNKQIEAVLDRLEAEAVENVNLVKIIGIRHIEAERNKLKGEQVMPTDTNETGEYPQTQTASYTFTSAVLIADGSSLKRRLKRLLCRHRWSWEHRSFDKVQLCTKCGKHGKTAPQDRRRS